MQKCWLKEGCATETVRGVDISPVLDQDVGDLQAQLWSPIPGAVEEGGAPGQVPGIHPGPIDDQVLDATKVIWKTKIKSIFKYWDLKIKQTELHLRF